MMLKVVVILAVIALATFLARWLPPANEAEADTEDYDWHDDYPGRAWKKAAPTRASRTRLPR